MEPKSLSTVTTFWMSKYVPIFFLKLQILPSPRSFSSFLGNFCFWLQILKPSAYFPKFEFDNHKWMIVSIYGPGYICPAKYTYFSGDPPPITPHIMIIIIKALSQGGRQDNGEGEQGPTGGLKFMLKKHLKCSEEYLFKICQHLKYQDIRTKTVANIWFPRKSGSRPRPCRWSCSRCQGLFWEGGVRFHILL